MPLCTPHPFHHAVTLRACTFARCGKTWMQLWLPLSRTCVFGMQVAFQGGALVHSAASANPHVGWPAGRFVVWAARKARMDVARRVAARGGRQRQRPMMGQTSWAFFLTATPGFHLQFATVARQNSGVVKQPGGGWSTGMQSGMGSRTTRTTWSSDTGWEARRRR